MKIIGLLFAERCTSYQAACRKASHTLSQMPSMRNHASWRAASSPAICPYGFQTHQEHI